MMEIRTKHPLDWGYGLDDILLGGLRKSTVLDRGSQAPGRRPCLTVLTRRSTGWEGGSSLYRRRRQSCRKSWSLKLVTWRELVFGLSAKTCSMKTAAKPALVGQIWEMAQRIFRSNGTLKPRRVVIDLSESCSRRTPSLSPTDFGFEALFFRRDACPLARRRPRMWVTRRFTVSPLA